MTDSLRRAGVVLAALLLVLSGCTSAARPAGSSTPPSGPASSARTESGQPVLPSPTGQNGLPPGIAGSALTNPPGTMGSQLPSWAQKEKGLKIPMPPLRPGAQTQILGADISEWQGPTNLGSYDRQFVIIREQYGTAGLDKQFSGNRDQARARNLPRSFYHYAYPQYNSPEAEARTMAYGTDWQSGEGAMLDFEESYGDPVGWSLRFLQTFESLRGFKPTLYINQYLLFSRNWGPVAANGNGLVEAVWNFNYTQPASGAFGFAAGKQYTDAEQVAGISGRVDGDVWYGDASSFLRYGAAAGAEVTPGGGAPAPAPVPTPAPAGCSHVVRSGETLSGLTSNWRAVAAGNGISNPNRIFVGQVVNLCATGSVAVGSGTASGCVTVRRGDTLSGLFGARWQQVAAKNGIKNPNLIFPGERVCA